MINDISEVNVTQAINL